MLPVWLTNTGYPVAHVSGLVKSHTGADLALCAPGLALCLIADCLRAWHSKSFHAAAAGLSLTEPVFFAKEQPAASLKG